MRADRIRIATWNCLGAPPTAEDFFEGKPFWPERFASRKLIETLAAYDIVCVQENLVDKVRESLAVVQHRASFRELWFDPMGPDLEDGTFVGGGLALLSRFPIRTRFVRLSRGAGPDGFARKGLAVAEVFLPSGRELAVLNTHLQADDANVPREECRQARALQLAGLREQVRAERARGIPVVLCGDLNITHGTDEYDDLETALGDDLVDLAAMAKLTTYDVVRNDLAAVFAAPGAPDRALVDYIWTSRSRFDASEVRTIFDEPLPDIGAPPHPHHTARPFSSDHFGIAATLDLVT